MKRYILQTCIMKRFINNASLHYGHCIMQACIMKLCNMQAYIMKRCIMQLQACIMEHRIITKEKIVRFLSECKK